MSQADIQELEWLKKSNQKLDEASQRLIRFCKELPKPLFAPVEKGYQFYRWTFLTQNPLIRLALIQSFLNGIEDHKDYVKNAVDAVGDDFFSAAHSTLILQGRATGDWPVILAQAILADLLNLYLDRMEREVGDQYDADSSEFFAQCSAILTESRTIAIPIDAAAMRRKIVRVLDQVMTEGELNAWEGKEIEARARAMEKEVQKVLEQVKADQSSSPKALQLVHELERLHEQTRDLGWEAKFKALTELGSPKIDELKKNIKRLR